MFSLRKLLMIRHLAVGLTPRYIVDWVSELALKAWMVGGLWGGPGVAESKVSVATVIVFETYRPLHRRALLPTCAGQALLAVSPSMSAERSLPSSGSSVHRETVNPSGACTLVPPLTNYAASAVQLPHPSNDP